MNTEFIIYAIVIIIAGGLLCLLAFFLIVADAQRSVEPPSLPRYGDDHD